MDQDGGTTKIEERACEYWQENTLESEEKSEGTVTENVEVLARYGHLAPPELGDG